MLIRVKDQAHLWAASYDRTGDSVTALQVEIASLVASAIGRSIDVEADSSSSPGDPQSLATPPADAQALESGRRAGLQPSRYSTPPQKIIALSQGKGWSRPARREDRVEGSWFLLLPSLNLES